jgi:hypothetical protein
LRPILFQAVCTFVLIVTSFFCAGQISPSGGPVDTTPPQILVSFPSPNSLNFHGHTIALSFSKYIDHGSLEQSLFFSPPINDLTFNWGGTDLELKFADSLRKNTTYILTIGTDVVDLRNHNRMAKAFSLAFSTGEYIDSASVSGKVFDLHPEGIMVYAYLLNRRNADTLNPSHTVPDYLTQTGKEGTFLISNIALGSYRLVAVRDVYKNLLYDVQLDDYGMTEADVVVDTMKLNASGIQFRMTKEDTSLPFLSSARSIDRSHFLLRFNKPMDTTAHSAGKLTITDTVHSKELPWVDLSFDPSAANQAQLVTALQDTSAIYRVTLSGFNDSYGNMMNTKGAGTLVTPTNVPDTMKPTLEFEGFSEHLNTVQRDDTLRITFNEPVRRNAFGLGCALTDTMGNTINGIFRWWGSMSVAFFPAAPLTLGETYQFKIIMDSVRDLAGNSTHDSIMVKRFTMVEEKYLGRINGTVSDEKTDAHGNIHIIASEITNKNVKPRELLLASPGPFVFNELPEGKYTFSLYRDADNSGGYSYGKPFPYRPAERFSVGTDTLRVRARWPLEGVLLKLK